MNVNTQPVINWYDRESLIAWLVWNDPNGVYTDEQSRAEGMEPLTLFQARALYVEQFSRE